LNPTVVDLEIINGCSPLLIKNNEVEKAWRYPKNGWTLAYFNPP
jgi:hypothetical protein